LKAQHIQEVQHMAMARRLSIVRDPADPTGAQTPVRRAIRQLQDTLAGRGVAAQVYEQIEQAPADEPCILVAGRSSSLAQMVLERAGVAMPGVAEALALVPGRLAERPVLLACGSDARGLAYAVLELADRATYAADPLETLQFERPVVEQPANQVRSIARLFTSEVEDKPWFYDRAFWERYLSMLAAQRFNRFSLTLGLGYNFPRHVTDVYFYFAYPFLVTVPGYDVRARGLPDEERERNLAMLRFISDEAAARGLHFQLALWTHAYEWIESPEANYVIDGLTPATHAAYCRDALRTLLEACPAIQGVTFRVHGESGIPEGSYEFWRTVFQGIVQTGRRIEIDMHAKGIDQQMIDVALATGLPVVVSPKYWAEHMGLPYHQASIRELERVPVSRGPGDVMRLSAGERRFTRYGYADLLTEDRPYGVLFRIWPGTQRLLLWGDPAMAAGYGRFSHFCDCLGTELCEPLSFKGRMGSGQPGGRDGYADPALRPAGGDWQKYEYTYRLWGRLLYNPETDPDSWRRYLRHEFDRAAGPAEEALASASRILPLVTTAYHPSASNNRYWPEIYTNMPIVDENRPHPYGDTPSPRRFGTVSALDPELFSRVDDFAAELLEGRRSGRYSPLDVARWLDSCAEAAQRYLAEMEALAPDRSSPAVQRWVADVAIQAGLGRFFAQKLRAGVAFALYRQSGDVAVLRQGIEAYRTARAAWAELAERAGIYRRDLTFGREPWLRGHWVDRLAAIEQDLADMEAELAKAGERVAVAGALARSTSVEDLFGAALEYQPPRARYRHAPPPTFRRGEPLTILLTLHDIEAAAGPVGVRLHYRRVNQAEPYCVVEMLRDGQRYALTIPGDYTDSPYPLQYFFELADTHGRAWLYPGFAEDLSNQPYFVVHQR
jgi:hypothetical protein